MEYEFQQDATISAVIEWRLGSHWTSKTNYTPGGDWIGETKNIRTLFHITNVLYSYANTV